MRTLSLLAAAWLLAIPALAAPSRLADQLDRADAAFAQTDWAQYRAVYAELSAAHPLRLPPGPGRAQPGQPGRSPGGV